MMREVSDRRVVVLITGEGEFLSRRGGSLTRRIRTL